MISNFKTGHKKLPVFSQRTGRKVGTGCCTNAGCNNVAKNGKFWVNNPIIVFFVPSWIMFIRNSRKGHSVPMHLRFGASLCIGTIITMSPNFVVFDIRLFRRGRKEWNVWMLFSSLEKIIFTIRSDIWIRESIQSNITQFVNASTLRLHLHSWG